MDLLENISIPDSPTSAILPDVIMQASPNTPDAGLKRKLIIKKKSPSIHSLSSYLTEEEPDCISPTHVSPLRMQQSFNCSRDTTRPLAEITKRRSGPKDGLVSERVKQWKENIAKQGDEKLSDSPIVKRYKRQHFHSQPTTPTKPMPEISRLRNPSVASTVSDTSSSGISDRSEILKSPISSSDASEVRTSPSSERSQPSYAAPGQESNHSTSLDSPSKSHVTTVTINPHSPTENNPTTTSRQTITTSYAILKNSNTKDKVRYFSEGSNVKTSSPENTAVLSANNSPFSSNTNSPTPSESGGSISTPTDKITFTPPPVIKPKPKLQPKFKELIKGESSQQIAAQRQNSAESTDSTDGTDSTDSKDGTDSIDIPTPLVSVGEKGQTDNPPITQENTTIGATENVESQTFDATPIQQEIPSPIQSPSPSPSPPPPPPRHVQPETIKPKHIKEIASSAVDSVPISSYIQINTLSDRIFKKSLKRGLEFTLLVVGESGLGKTTLIDSLFESHTYDAKPALTVQERKVRTTQIEQHQVQFVQRGVNMKINIIDTPGFGDTLDGTESCVPILTYINNQFERYYSDESGVNRRNIHDTRVHACLYFINPSGHGLRPMDVFVLKKLSKTVNVIPVIAKADTLSEEELFSLKEKVREELFYSNIDVYDCTADDSDLSEQEKEKIKNMLPYSVVGANAVVTRNGKNMIVREYPWGIVEIENPKHCDFSFLKSMLLGTHMSDLQSTTHEHLYEEFRKSQLGSGVPGRDTPVQEVDVMLVEKQLEIEKIREKMQALKEQLGISIQVTS